MLFFLFGFNCILYPWVFHHIFSYFCLCVYARASGTFSHLWALLVTALINDLKSGYFECFPRLLSCPISSLVNYSFYASSSFFFFFFNFCFWWLACILECYYLEQILRVSCQRGIIVWSKVQSHQTTTTTTTTTITY